MLGADLGSALVVRLLSLDLSAVLPLALAAGTAIFLATERRGWRRGGRILVGIGLLLLSLRMIGEASEPLREGNFMPVAMGFLATDPATAFLMAAITAWLFHSSVAFILLVVALAGSGIVSEDLGIVLVLGANLGGGLIAAMLSRGTQPEARAVPLANLALRGIGAVAALALVTLVPLPMEALGASDAARIMHAHILFNLVLLVLALPVAGRAHGLMLTLLLARRPATLDLGAVSALDDCVLDTPALALANVTREVVGICETIETMLGTVMELYGEPDRARIEALRGLDDRIDRRHHEIMLYLARMEVTDLAPAELQRMQELLAACIKLEQVGDIVTRNLLDHVQRKHDRGLSFSVDGWDELRDLHAALVANARIAFNLVVTRDSETALQLVRAKDRFRDNERRANALHFQRLREGGARSIDTSSLHLDTIRDLKQINALLAGLAYPVLEHQGLLLGSRLRPPEVCPA